MPLIFIWSKKWLLPVLQRLKKPSWTLPPPVFIAAFYNSQWHAPFLELFCILNCTVPLFLESVSCVSFVLEPPKGSFMPWGTQLRRSPGPWCCLRLGHTPHRWESGSSSPPPPTLGRCWQTGLDLSFSNCLGLESEQSLRRLVKGSWMETISHSHCNPGACWPCCCLR